jgi:hypothetical protein
VAAFFSTVPFRFAYVLTSGSTPYAGLCAHMTTVIEPSSLNLRIVFADIPSPGGFQGLGD